MKKIYILCVVFYILQFLNPIFSQINSGYPEIPFGVNANYKYGTMPTNLPTDGDYTKSKAAAEAYIYWKKSLTETCENGIRVKYDNLDQTVSEGIAYGMLLSAYAGDKDVFDGLWKYYLSNSNTHGVMHWKITDCSKILGYNGATDAELDAAMALIIASIQWPSSTYPYAYKVEALDLIESIRLYEIDNSTYQTLNGDTWGTGNTCRNPSYFAPAYYREFAKLDTTNASFWTNVANASEDFLLINRDNTTGLICNWSNNNGISNDCNNTSNLKISNEYGFDACRNPWRMATDVLWNGKSEADAAYDICNKIATWLNGYESNMKGPLAQNAANPGVGLYKNGTFSTYALATMVDSNLQTSLNSCYSSISNYSNETYFNQTIKTLTLFMLTGNFWSPSISAEIIPPMFFSATTNANGTVITVNLGKTLSLIDTSDYSPFTLSINGSEVTDAFSAILHNGTKAVNLILSTSVTIETGDILTLSYTPGSIESDAAVKMEAFSGKMVTNTVGTSTMIANCDNGNKTKLFTEWYSYNDNTDGGSSTITPLTDETSSFTMTAGGANATDSAAKIEYILHGEDALEANPFVGFGFALYADESEYDLEGSTGISFYHKGNEVNLQVILATNTDNNYYNAFISAHSNWTLVTLPWDKFAQENRGTSTQTVVWNTSQITKFQWQKQAVDNSTGEIWIDEIQIDGIVLDLPLEEGDVIKTTFAKTIARAQQIYDNVEAGTTEEQYPESAIDALQAAIATALEVYNNSDATQTEVNTANRTLNTAIIAFEASVLIINELDDLASSLNIYPNPINDILIIDVEDFQKASIATVSGQNLIISTKTTIDVSKLAKGIYTVTVTTKHGIISTIIVK